jgi:hypothetical protein
MSYFPVSCYRTLGDASLAARAARETSEDEKKIK